MRDTPRQRDRDPGRRRPARPRPATGGARGALEAIDTTGRGALTDMRRMLGRPRRGRDGQEPLPGLDRLGDLLEQVRAAGMSGGAGGRGQPPISRSGARAVGLPDHPGGAHELAEARRRRPRARVAVGYGPRALDISIDDERGPGAVPPSGGARWPRARRHARAGRDVPAATSRPGRRRRGFRVTARLPVEGRRRP